MPTQEGAQALAPNAGEQQPLPIEGQEAPHDGRREHPEGEERRDRRSRDRYGRDRDRRERQPQGEGAGTPAANEATLGETAEATQPGDRLRYPTGFVNEEPQPSAAQAPAARAPEPLRQAAAPAAPVAAAPVRAPAPAPAAQGLPKVQPFQLPVDDLARVAEGSGLQWVNSDVEKIAAVQAAIASEPKPVRVPRERPPMIVMDEGPLVLVETRRDLRDMKLPFEQQGTLPLQ
jgi:ribonuclease E